MKYIYFDHISSSLNKVFIFVYYLYIYIYIPYSSQNVNVYKALNIFYFLQKKTVLTYSRVNFDMLEYYH